MRPHIGRIGRDKERQIANQSDAAGMRILLQLFSLPQKQELAQSNLLKLAGQFLPRLASDEGRRSTYSGGHWR